MKKIFLTIVLVLSMTTALFAQAEGSTIGLRLGYPTEVSYQKGLSDKNRIELGLGFRTYIYATSISVSGMYQWVNDLSSVTNGLAWYYGGGAQIGFYSYVKTYIPISVLGQVGVQYGFENIPLRLSLDWRPGFQFGSYSNGFVGDGFCLGVRYIFKK